MKQRIYIAAPLFSEGELEFNFKVNERLQECFSTFLPQKDGRLIVELIKEGVPRETAVQRIFDLDTQAIESCDILLLIMDGRSVDEGACFELGYAYALGKLCVGLQTDQRRLLPSGNNPILESALCRIFESIDDLTRWLSSTEFAAELDAKKL